MYYSLLNYCKLVRGAQRGAIYNLHTGKVFSINSEALQFLLSCDEKPLEELIDLEAKEDSIPLNLLHKITAMGLGSFFIHKPNHLKTETIDNEELLPLDFLWLELTSNCNNNCLHCYANSDPSNNNDWVPHERWLHLISEARKEGAAAIQLIGGEPLLYPRWRELVIRAYEEGFELIEIFTNGTLIDDACIEFFQQHKVNIATTIYAGNAEVHDKVTRNPNSFKSTIESIKKLKLASIPIRISSIIMKVNQDEVENLTKLCEELGVVPPVPELIRPTGRGDKEELFPTSYRNTPIRPTFYTNEHDFARAQRYHNCLAGKIAVTSNGDVIPCIFAREKRCGNIIDKPLSEVLKDTRLQECWLITKDDIDKCKDCEYRYACYDCRPIAQGSNREKGWLACIADCLYNPYEGKWDDESEDC